MQILVFTYDFRHYPYAPSWVGDACETYILVNADPVEHGGQWDYLSPLN